MDFKTVLIAVCLMQSGAAFAQQAAPAPTENQTIMPGNTPAQQPKVVDPAPTNGALKPGANSFTEAQARERLEKAGYTNISDLAKTQEGFWRGRATKNGVSVQVSLDFQGNVSQS